MSKCFALPAVVAYAFMVAPYFGVPVWNVYVCDSELLALDTACLAVLAAAEHERFAASLLLLLILAWTVVTQSRLSRPIECDFDGYLVNRCTVSAMYAYVLWCASDLVIGQEKEECGD